MDNIQLFHDFRSNAAIERFSYCSMPHDHNGGWFNLYFNQGDIYLEADPQRMYDLVMFARKHAAEKKADFFDQRDAYGILSRVTYTDRLNENANFVIWDWYRYEAHDPTVITVAEWLEMYGYIVPISDTDDSNAPYHIETKDIFGNISIYFFVSFTNAARWYKRLKDHPHMESVWGTDKYAESLCRPSFIFE